MKKQALLLTAIVILSLTSCSDNTTEAAVTITTAETTQTTVATTVETTNTTTAATEKSGNTEENPINSVWQKYFDELKFAKQMKIADINHNGTSEIIFLSDDFVTLAYCYNGEIKELRSAQYWGDGILFYYNEITNGVMTISSHGGGYRKYTFYDFADGDYILTNELTVRELDIPWSEEKITEVWSNWSEEARNKFPLEEMLENPLGDGHYDRVNQYKINDTEVSEAKWQNTIDDFINADGCITLSSRNPDTDFVDIDNMNGDFSEYIKENL